MTATRSSQIARHRPADAPQWLGRWLALVLWVVAVGTARAQPLAEVLRYDERGNVAQREAHGRITTYRYDALNRLREEGVPGSQRFDLDADGNRLADGRSVYSVQPAAQRLAARDGTAWVHGPAGHLLADRAWLGARWVPRRHDWNLAGRLSAIHLNGVMAATYVYNEAGQRTRKILNALSVGMPAVMLYRHGPAGQLVMEVAGTPVQAPGVAVAAGQVLVRYVWQDAVPVAVIWPPMTPGNPHGPTDRIVYLHTDHLNTPRRATDANGLVVWQWDSDAFGASAPDEDVDRDGRLTSINLRFPGQYFDAESGLHYNWHRYYDPQVGRYTQSDPIGLAGGINTYTYAEGQPTSLTDPMGLATFMCTVPLQTLGGEGLRSGPDVPGNLLYHQYVCVPDAHGKMQCSGQDRASGAFGPGKPSDDKFKPESCEKVVDDNKCVEDCILSAGSNPRRPPYWLVGGGTARLGGEVPSVAMNCQQWADYQVRRCVAQCRNK